MKENELRAAIIAQCRAMNANGLNQGTSGNISARFGDTMLVTPSAIPYESMRPAMIVAMPIEHDYGAWAGPYPPSVEWRFHLDILRARPDVGAIVHCHATYATALAMLHKPIPAAHYMIAAFGGPSVRCTAYAPYGTKELSELAVAGLEARNGVLLGNHGLIAVGQTLGQAMWRASELETLARMYCIALTIGEPVLLAEDEIMRTVERFKTYGQGLDIEATAEKAVTPRRIAARKSSAPPASSLRGAKRRSNPSG